MDSKGDSARFKHWKHKGRDAEVNLNKKCLNLNNLIVEIGFVEFSF